MSMLFVISTQTCLCASTTFSIYALSLLASQWMLSELCNRAFKKMHMYVLFACCQAGRKTERLAYLIAIACCLDALCMAVFCLGCLDALCMAVFCLG